MVHNRVKPALDSENSINNIANKSHRPLSSAAVTGAFENSTASNKEFNDFESISTVHLEESSYLKLKPFSRLDPTLVRLLKFLECFGLFVCTPDAHRPQGSYDGRGCSRFFRTIITLLIAVITSEVVYDVNLRQSRLLAEQKRSTPLLTFVIVLYSWLTLVIPIICDISLIFIGPYLFRFYSRTTATVCNGTFFGKKTSADTWYYYVGLVLIAFLDVVGQVVLLGVWPKSIDTYMRMVVMPSSRSSSTSTKPEVLEFEAPAQSNSSVLVGSNVNNITMVGGLIEDANQQPAAVNDGPKITTYLLDFVLGQTYAHNDLGVIIKVICLMVQFMHSYAFLIIIISLADHYATAINNINENLDKYEFRRLLKQLIILRDSSEQISLMISLPFSLIIMLVFMRQIALSGVFIQSTMQPYENWAVSLQFLTCSVSIFMVFIYCDGLQNASKQTHRLKTEQTVINENRGGNQSIYEFLDYLDRLSKSIRITFFNIIAINKSSLVGLFGHILTLTFVTS
jgi:hypothetical protein